MKNVIVQKCFLCILILSISILFFGCDCDITEDKEIPIIAISDLEKQSLSLNDIVDEIKYVVLDNSVIIAKIANVNATDFLFLIENKNEVLAFSNKGEFINRIGNRGQGPHEYINVVDFPIDTKNQKIYVVSSHKVYNYNYQGKFNYSFLLPENSVISKVKYKNNNLYFASGFGSYEQDFEWMITDTIGNVLYRKENLNKEFISTIDFYKNQLFEIDSEFYYWDELKDTIFQINAARGEPAFIFANDKYRMEPEDVMSLENLSEKPIWYLLSVLGNKSFLLLRYGNAKEQENILAVFDRETGRLYELKRISILNKHISREREFIVNSWDGGLPFFPRNKVKTKSGEWFIQWINAIDLKAHVESNEFINSTPKYPEKKKELEQLANRLDDNDNPVLMLVKLKE